MAKRKDRIYYLHLLNKYKDLNNDEGIKAMKEVLKAIDKRTIQKSLAGY